LALKISKTRTHPQHGYTPSAGAQAPPLLGPRSRKPFPQIKIYHYTPGTKLLAERHLPGRECGIMASPALRVIGRSHRNATRRTTMGDRAFAVAAPRVWNSLPDAIRRSSSLAIF